MDLKLYVDSNFEGVDKDGLKQLLRAAGAKVAPNAGEEWMKNAIRRLAGGEQAQEIAPPSSNVVPLGAMPNLTPNGRWTGRRHLVTVINTSGDPKLKGITVHWEGKPEDLLFNQPKSIGEPWWNVIKTTRTTLTSWRTVTENDGTKRILIEDSTVPTISYHYGGLDPETAHLPGSLLEYYQILARQKDNFARYKRRPLLTILSQLRPELGESRTKDMADADLRYEILKFLGPDFSMGEADEHEEQTA